MAPQIILDEGNDAFKIIKEMWNKRAKETTLEDLPGFLNELTGNYKHDYGTICHAIAAAAIASASAVDKSEQGGITGFQAGAVMWEFIRAWNYSHNKTGLSLVNYDDFLYPQYEDRFDKTILPSVWKNVKEEALKNIEEADAEYVKYVNSLEQYEKDTAAFVLKYPDHPDNKEHYDVLFTGSIDEIDIQNSKIESGFEFYPKKPYLPISKTDDVYIHWESIVNDIVPFGFKVSCD